MLSKAKEKLQGVDVVDLLRPKGVLLFVMYFAKTLYAIKRVSLDERRANKKSHEGTLLSVNDRVRFFSFVKYFAKILYAIKRVILDEEREKGKFPKGCCSKPTAPCGNLPLTKLFAKITRFRGCR